MWYGFLDTLDPDVLTRLCDFPENCATVENYNLFMHQDDRLARWRRQAFSESMLLARLAARPLRAAWTSFAMRQQLTCEILGIIDSGRPLHASIARALNVRCALLRRSGSLTLDFLPVGEVVDCLLQIGALVPPEAYPTTDDEDYLRYLWFWLAHLDLPRRRLLIPLASRTRKRFREELSVFAPEVVRLAHVTADTDLDPALAPPSFDIARDFLEEVRMCLGDTYSRLGSQGCDDGVPGALRTMVVEWLETNGVSSFMRTANAWHDLILADHDETRFSEMNGPIRWTPLVNGPVQVRSRVFVELSDRSALMEEGNSMRHCVSSYAGRCAQGTRVFSLRDPGTDTRISTLALSSRMVDGDLRFAIEQLRGYENAVVGNACVEASLELVELVNSLGVGQQRAAILSELGLFSVAGAEGNSTLIKLALHKAGRRGRPAFQPLWEALIVRKECCVIEGSTEAAEPTDRKGKGTVKFGQTDLVRNQAVCRTSKD